MSTLHWTGQVGRIWVIWVLAATGAAAAEPVSLSEASQALARAVGYARDHVAARGGYLWWYKSDLTERWGEGRARPSQIWVQPPGTPSVGMAYLRAHERTGDELYLDLGRQAAHALAWGQLASGGWAYSIDFDPEPSRNCFYRRDTEAGQTDPGQRYNLTVFDDDTSQAALRLLMLYDQAAEFKDPVAGRAVRYGLEAFLRYQYPNGAWPQRCSEDYEPARYPVVPARYPESWSRTFPDVDYKLFYTLNDAVIPDMIDTMILAYRIYGDRRYLASACKAGDFLILAQMPEPQPAWAQQYDLEMAPAWARRFEPPSVVTSESVSVIRSLMRLYVETGEDKYRRPIPTALAWFKRSTLPDGRHARFYELKTNRPLYFTTKYELVYTDDDLPTHYAFKTNVDVAGLQRRYDQLDRARKDFLKVSGGGRGPSKAVDWGPGHGNLRNVRSVIDALDEAGRWVEDDVIEMSTFIRNVDTLSAYIAARRAEQSSE